MTICTKKNILMVSAALLGALGVAVLVWAINFPCPDPRNMAFCMWKSGFMTIQADKLAMFIGNNQAEENSLIGLTEIELSGRVKGLKTADDRNAEQKAYQLGQIYPDCAGYWLGESPIAIFIKNGKVVRVSFLVG